MFFNRKHINNSLGSILGQNIKNDFFYNKYFGYKRVLDGFWARIDAGFEFSIKKKCILIGLKL